MGDDIMDKRYWVDDEEFTLNYNRMKLRFNEDSYNEVAFAARKNLEFMCKNMLIVLTDRLPQAEEIVCENLDTQIDFILWCREISESDSHILHMIRKSSNQGVHGTTDRITRQSAEDIMELSRQALLIYYRFMERYEIEVIPELYATLTGKDLWKVKIKLTFRRFFRFMSRMSKKRHFWLVFIFVIMLISSIIDLVVFSINKVIHGDPDTVVESFEKDYKEGNWDKIYDLCQLNDDTEENRFLTKKAFATSMESSKMKLSIDYGSNDGSDSTKHYEYSATLDESIEVTILVDWKDGKFKITDINGMVYTEFITLPEVPGVTLYVDGTKVGEIKEDLEMFSGEHQVSFSDDTMFEKKSYVFSTSAPDDLNSEIKYSETSINACISTLKKTVPVIVKCNLEDKNVGYVSDYFSSYEEAEDNRRNLVNVSENTKDVGKFHFLKCEYLPDYYDDVTKGIPILVSGTVKCKTRLMNVYNDEEENISSLVNMIKKGDKWVIDDVVRY